MKTSRLLLVGLMLGSSVLAAPLTTYHTINRRPVSMMSMPSPYSTVAAYPPTIYAYPPRPQVSVVLPNVSVYYQPQPQTYYHRTEEVVLPQGGVYRRSVEALPQYDYADYPYSYGTTIIPPRGHVIISSGRYGVY